MRSKQCMIIRSGSNYAHIFAANSTWCIRYPGCYCCIFLPCCSANLHTLLRRRLGISRHWQQRQSSVTFDKLTLLKACGAKSNIWMLIRHEKAVVSTKNLEELKSNLLLTKLALDGIPGKIGQPLPVTQRKSTRPVFFSRGDANQPLRFYRFHVKLSRLCSNTQ